jgi:hypothetical protein
MGNQEKRSMLMKLQSHQTNESFVIQLEHIRFVF